MNRNEILNGDPPMPQFGKGCAAVIAAACVPLAIMLYALI